MRGGLVVDGRQDEKWEDEAKRTSGVIRAAFVCSSFLEKVGVQALVRRQSLLLSRGAGLVVWYGGGGVVSESGWWKGREGGRQDEGGEEVDEADEVLH